MNYFEVMYIFMWAISDVKKVIGNNDSNTVLFNFFEAFQWQATDFRHKNLQFYILWFNVSADSDFAI